ncbi:pyridoxamine 5'-phosphate oxidase-domain-containing protein [Talaromyces proteolyticus]|uniref:Pyridoxamine 5'-phosphate oxidase-domain-containing protein n=1 Tax=Talaromyces proteolyticus TaxID=1131652 RepID=A0AAD4KDZ2_9EURO|nr:pyridoxamine 5'-phosphate oxidase-domain-containing protein [Talaromyces proteolyticus]KAH8689569.1 pyridoxamine 5'-phosphate oxidase-domain-containing protein [Talaromyces proteolyticus]
MAKFPRYLYGFLTAGALFSTCTSAIPFVIGASQQAALTDNAVNNGDPLKDFISDVANDKKPTSPPTTSPSILRLAFDIPNSNNIHTTSDAAIDNPADVNHNDNDNLAVLARPSWFTSVLLARRLLALSTTATVSTVYQQSSRHSPAGLQGTPITLPEYIADCNSLGGAGNPILLGLYVSTTFQNVASGSNVSLAIDWWSHLDKTSPLYPGFPPSAAGLPRVSLLGYIERVSADTEENKNQKGAVEEFERCFLAAHPDSKAWLPGNKDSPHSGFWARLVVTQAYWIGGFGDIQQIGWINMTEWKGIREESSLPGIGDGRGWASVRLPGEEA